MGREAETRVTADVRVTLTQGHDQCRDSVHTVIARVRCDLQRILWLAAVGSMRRNQCSWKCQATKSVALRKIPTPHRQPGAEAFRPSRWIRLLSDRVGGR